MQERRSPGAIIAKTYRSSSNPEIDTEKQYYLANSLYRFGHTRGSRGVVS